MQMKKHGVFSTKSRLMDAMVKIGNQKGFLRISIKEICELAEINRSTFYRNYESKDHLLREIETEYLHSIDLLCESYHTINILDDATAVENCRSIASKIYAYHLESKETFRFLMSPNCDPYFRDRMKRLLQTHFHRLLCATISSPPESIGYVIEFISAGIIDCLYRWIQQQDLSEADFADIVTRLILLSMQACLPQ